ncbi:MAG: hypothetical protein ACLFVB_07835 [Thermoplasmata archaeon]
MKCPDCNTSDSVVKDGTRDTKLGEIQKYHCKKCSKYFSEKKLPNTQYPPKVIFYTKKQAESPMPSGIRGECHFH